MQHKAWRMLLLGCAILLLSLLVATALLLSQNILVSSPERVTESQSQGTLWRGAGASNVPLAEGAQRAGDRATQWAADAILVRAEAAWRSGVDGLQIETPALSWSFYYYSPDTRSLASVGVATEQKVFWVPPVEIPSLPEVISVFPPPYGVDVAWLSFRAAGGDAFLQQYPNALVNFQLYQSQELLVWSVSAMDEDAYSGILLDALSGSVISLTP
ncbi:MAG: hypothetical protein JXA33_15655 [Anaerolineae bacterium]|nr:hypothetical protein [Anaerolineae bacterium]